MTVGELINIFRQNNIPNDATLMSDSGWECCATDMDGVYYNKLENTVVFTQKIVSMIGILVQIYHTNLMTGLFIQLMAKRWTRKVNNGNRR